MLVFNWNFIVRLEFIIILCIDKPMHDARLNNNKDNELVDASLQKKNKKK